MALSPANFLMYFSLAWGANIALNFLYVIKRYIPKSARFDRPIDGGLVYRGDRLVGDSTTLVGLTLSLVLSVIIYFITLKLMWASIPILVYFGDLLGGFIKRRLHKKVGEFVPFIDHGDYMLFLGAVFVFQHYISVWFAGLAIIITYILHPLACLIAFKLKLREHPY